MSPEVRTFVVETAKAGALQQLTLVEENFLEHEAFDPRPNDEASLQAAWSRFSAEEDEPWWHLWEAVSDELDEADEPAARELLVATFEATLLTGLRAHLDLTEPGPA